MYPSLILQSFNVLTQYILIGIVFVYIKNNNTKQLFHIGKLLLAFVAVNIPSEPSRPTVKLLHAYPLNQYIRTQQISMNEDHKKSFEEMFHNLCTSFRNDLTKESHTQRAQLDYIQARLDQKSHSSEIKPDIFDGNPTVDAMIWFDSFSRVANINNWSKEIQINAFPLFLSGVARAWFLSLSEDVKSDLGKLKAAFQERFASQSHDWIIFHQLSTRKQAKGEPIGEYIADITRLCHRLKLSEADLMRYFTQGLQPNIQSYVILARPKSFQEAESLARMKELVDNNQRMSETQTLLTQMEVMFKKFMTQPAFENSKTVVATEPNQLHRDNRLNELSTQGNHLQMQTQPHNSRKLQGNFHCPLTNFEGKQIARLRTRFYRRKFWGKSHLLYDSRLFRTPHTSLRCNYCFRVGHSLRTCRVRKKKN